MKKEIRKNMFPIFVRPFVHFTDQKRMDPKNTKTVITSHLKLLNALNFTEIRVIVKENSFFRFGICVTFCW